MHVSKEIYLCCFRLSSKMKDSPYEVRDFLCSNQWKNKSEGALALPRFCYHFDLAGLTR